MRLWPGGAPPAAGLARPFCTDPLQSLKHTALVGAGRRPAGAGPEPPKPAACSSPPSHPPAVAHRADAPPTHPAAAAMFWHFKEPVMIVEGKMQYLFDERGKRYLDVSLCLLWRAAAAAHPRVARSPAAQCRQRRPTRPPSPHATPPPAAGVCRDCDGQRRPLPPGRRLRGQRAEPAAAAHDDDLPQQPDRRVCQGAGRPHARRPQGAPPCAHGAASGHRGLPRLHACMHARAWARARAARQAPPGSCVVHHTNVHAGPALLRHAGGLLCQQRL